MQKSINTLSKMCVN